MIIFILLISLISLIKSQVQLYIGAISGTDPTNCQENTISICTNSSPCQSLTCALEYANATLTDNPNQNLKITFFTPSKPLEKNYTLSKSGQNQTFWLNFNGSFLLTGNTVLTPTVANCALFPVLSLQYFRSEFLFINATGGVQFQYINFQVLLAYEPITIYSYGFTLQNVCIGMNKANTIGLLPNYEQIIQKKGPDLNITTPYKSPKYRMLVLESGGVSNESMLKLMYNFNNIIIEYNGDDFQNCGGTSNTYMITYISKTSCHYYYLSALIAHRSIDNNTAPYLNFENLTIECPLKKYLKVFHSDNSLEFHVINMTTNCFPTFEAATNYVNILNVTLDNNAFNDNLVNKSSTMVNSGPIVFDLTSYGGAYIQYLSIMNYEIGVCNDYEFCNINPYGVPNSLISIYDNNTNGANNRILLEKESEIDIEKVVDIQVEEYYQDDKRILDNNNNYNNNDNEAENNILYHSRINQQNSSSQGNFPDLSMPDLHLYTNITRDPSVILHPDYLSYHTSSNRVWSNSFVVIDKKFAIIIKDITISNNSISPYSKDSFFSFVYISASASSATMSYVLENIIYTNNIGNNAYQHYGFTLYDSYGYLMNNITYMNNYVSRFAIIGSLSRQVLEVVLINNTNITHNNYNMVNNLASQYDIYHIDNPDIGIFDITSSGYVITITIFNMSVSNNIFNFTKILNIKNSLILYQFEQVYTYIYNVEIKNNSLTDSNFLIISGFNLYMENITFTNNTIKSSSVFDLSYQANQFNTFILLNSNLVNNTFLQSYFVQKELDLYSAFKSSETQGTSNMLPFWITVSNCTFNEFTLGNNSAILQFTSIPFVFIFNNTFRNSKISQTSAILQGNDFVDSLKKIPDLTNQIHAIIQQFSTLDMFTSQIFQSSLELLKSAGIYSDIQLFDHSNKQIKEVFITRIAYNTFSYIVTNISSMMQFGVCSTNYMLISIDHNVIKNVDLINYLDNFAKFDSIDVIGLADNNFMYMSGSGYVIQIIDHINAKISNNYMLNNNGSSFMRIASYKPKQTLINNNMISSIFSAYSYITVIIQYNDGLITLDNNIFYDIHMQVDLSTYQQFNLIYIQVSASNSTIDPFQSNNNSYIQINFVKNHPLIKQFHNSLIFLSNPDNPLQFQHNVFYNISVFYDDNLLFIITQTCQFYNNTLTYILNNDNTGSLYFLGEFINITKCKFQYNHAIHGNGGAIYIDYDKLTTLSITHVLLNSNIFRNNYAIIGAALYLYGSTIRLNAQNNHFYKGEFTQTDIDFRIVHLKPVLGVIAFNEVTIQDNLIINSNMLYSQHAKYQYTFLYFSSVISLNSNASIEISSFNMSSNNDTFAAIQINNCSQVQFSLNNISLNIGVVNSHLLSFLSTDSGIITLSRFHLNLLNGYGSFIDIQCNSGTNTSLSIINSIISNYYTPLISSGFGIIHISSEGSNNSCYQTLNTKNFTINQVSIKWIANWTQDFSAIYVDYPGNTNITLNQSKFLSMHSLRGSVLNLNNWPIPPTSNNSLNNVSVFADSPDKSNSSINLTQLALSEGIQIINATYAVYVIIDNCEFINNTATFEGGAIYNTYNNLSITNSIFSNNKAEYRTGAAIFSINTNSYTQILNPSSNNTFLNNKRYYKKYYGIYSDNASLGSPPVSMNLTIMQTSNSYVNIINYTNNNSFLLKNISTHDLNELILNIGLIDTLGQIFYESPNGDIDLSPKLTNTRMVTIFTDTSSASSPNCDFVNCYIANTTLILKGMAGSRLPINISYQSDMNTVPNLIINSILRSCIVGEINSSRIQGGEPAQSICTLCPPNSYSLKLVDSSCSECNFGDSAQCLGGNYILISPGYWRYQNLSNVIYECPNYFACLGGFNSDCAQGYVGPLCQSCDTIAGYARAGANICGICPDKTQQTLIALGYLALVIIYQIYMIRSTILENLAFYQNGMTPEEEKAKSQAQYIRLLTTYSQIISIILTFQLQYPSFVKEPVGKSSSAPATTIFSSTLCLLMNYGYNTESVVFYKIGLVSAIPFIKMIIICFLLSIVLSTCKRKMDPILKKAFYLATIFCIMLVDQPGLFNELVNYLTCIQIDNEGPYYLLSDYGVECYTSSYNYYLLLIVLPSLLIWGFIIPGGLLIIMFKNRKNLSNQLLRLNLGGIYNEYTDQAYYWGIVLMVMKLLLMFSAAILYDDTKTEAMTVFFILCVYLVAHTFIKPIKKLEIHKAEQMATTSYLITIFFALYYKDNRYQACAIFAVIFLAAANFYAIGYLLYKLIMLNLKSIPCLKKYLVSRQNSQQITFLPDKVKKNGDNLIENKDKTNNIDDGGDNNEIDGADEKNNLQGNKKSSEEIDLDTAYNGANNGNGNNNDNHGNDNDDNGNDNNGNDGNNNDDNGDEIKFDLDFELELSPDDENSPATLQMN